MECLLTQGAWPQTQHIVSQSNLQIFEDAHFLKLMSQSDNELIIQELHAVKAVDRVNFTPTFVAYK